MKKTLFIFLSIVISYCAIAQGVTTNGQVTSNGSAYVNKNGAIGTSTGVNANGQIIAAASLPTVTTTSISTVTDTTAFTGGTVTSNGGLLIIAEGVCWDTSPNPTIALSTRTNDGTGVGSFVSTITGLKTNAAVYYVRAYATNSLGTAYGNAITFTAHVQVGSIYQGGIVASVSETNNIQTGLIASASSLGTAKWSNNYDNLNSTATGGGQANTTAIVNDQGAGTYAAQLCNDYSVVGADGVTYNDWYLPNKSELAILYNNKAAIGGFGTTYYWSSSQSVSTSAWAQSFNTGLKQADDKVSSTFVAVRAVRVF